MSFMRTNQGAGAKILPYEPIGKLSEVLQRSGTGQSVLYYPKSVKRVSLPGYTVGFFYLNSL